MKKISFLIILLTLFFLHPLPSFAETEFSTSYDVTYDVGLDGVTDVTQKISLKNLTSRYYASNFILTIGSTTVSDVLATDEGGQMETKIENKDGKTAITLKFNQQVAGIDKKQIFTLKFKSKDFAQKVGRTWEINLPKIPEGNNIENYNLVLSVPAEFGDPTSIVPTPRLQSQTFERLFFTFTKEQLTSSGISLNFGTSQVFDFVLNYNLENDSLFPVITSVTLPPDTRYQDVLISNITPEPLNVTVDEDGNYLAWYKLSRRSKQEVVVNGSAKLYISPKTQQPELLSPEQKQNLIKSDKYWEKDNPVILSALREIFKEGTPKTTREKARLIYRYVVDHLKYSAERLNSDNLERLGAVTALNNPNAAVCMEFTDLFVALMRAAGIPARELDGFAYSQNPKLRPLSLSKDLLHAWPEYYDEEKGWVMVDPTWENTSGGIDYFNKFDLNHLVFAIKGVSSTSPDVSDNVKVTISENDFVGKPQLDIGIETSETLWAGLPIVLSVKVLNRGNFPQGPTSLSLDTEKIKVLGSKTLSLGPIPPFGSTTYKFNLRTPFTWQEFEDKLEVEVAGQKYTKKVTVKPLFLYAPIPFVIVGLGVVVLGIYLIILIFHIYKKKFSNKVTSKLTADPTQSAQAK